MSPFLLLIVILSSLPLNHSVTRYTRSKLTPSQTSDNGASIIQNRGTINNNKWSLAANQDPPTEYDLILTLSSTYGIFHPTVLSTLNITLITSIADTTTSTHDLTVAFQQTGFGYLNLLINYDDGSDNLVYPDCDRWGTSSGYGSLDFAHLQTNYWGEIYYRTSDDGWGYWLDLPSPNAETQSPVTFTLENNPSPSDNLIFRYQSASEPVRPCGFNPAMNAETEMKIYIAANEYYTASSYDTIEIEEILITYWYEHDGTNDPSKHPTKPPTKAPSRQPSGTPTNLPSESPTKLPSRQQPEHPRK